MRTIYKYPLASGPDEPYSTLKLATPQGSFKPLTVQMQNGVACLWAEVEHGNHDPFEFSAMRVVGIVGTGRQVPTHLETYCGSFQLPNGEVGHVYADCRSSL